MSAEAEDDAFISVFISAERSDVSENPAEVAALIQRTQTPDSHQPIDGRTRDTILSDYNLQG